MGIKGITRQYRKACRRLGVKFPHRGTFHVTCNGNAIKPENMTTGVTYLLRNGPAPAHAAAAAVEALPPAPKGWESTETPLPALPAVYKRTERVGISNGKEKKRVDYKEVKNPKGGETYYVKRTVDNKPKWVEINYSKLLADLELAA